MPLPPGPPARLSMPGFCVQSDTVCIDRARRSLPIGGVGLDQERSAPSVDLVQKRPGILLSLEDLGTAAYASLFDLSRADFGAGE